MYKMYKIVNICILLLNHCTCTFDIFDIFLSQNLTTTNLKGNEFDLFQIKRQS